MQSVNDLSVQVLQGFGVRAKKVLREKSYYICKTDKGDKIIRKSFDTAERIVFQHEIKAHLQSQGFTHTDMFDLSASHKPFVEFDGCLFTMSPLISFNETDFSNNRLFESVVTQTAAFHKAARHVKFSSRVYYADSGILDVYIKNLADLNAIKKRVSSQKRFSDFDVLFLKNYHYYAGQLETAIETLDKTSFKQYVARAKANNAICHGLLKEENLLQSGGRIYITNFSHAAVGYSLLDLCNIIRRYVKRLPDPCLHIEDIVALYDAVMPLGKEEQRMLYPLLIYPHKFIRICGQYYSKKRTWTPNAITNRMEAVVNSRDAYHAYVERVRTL